MWHALLNRPAEVRLSAELESPEGVGNEYATHRRWYVLEADFGGQILATVPVEMVPAWVGRRRLRRALRFAVNVPGGFRNEDGLSVYVVEDFGFYVDRSEIKDDPELREAVMEACNPWIERRYCVMPLGLAMAGVDCEPRGHYDKPAKLSHWQFIGFVPGGMGGGWLLDNDAWFHYGLLYQGLPFINRLRFLLGLRPLSELNLEMDEADRNHMDLITTFLG